MNDTLLEAFDYQYTGTRQPLAGRRIRQNPARTMATLRELARIVSDEQSPVSDQIEKLRGLGWKPRLTSNEAIDRAVDEIVREVVG